MELQHINSHWTGFETRWTCSTVFVVVLFQFRLVCYLASAKHATSFPSTIQLKRDESFVLKRTTTKNVFSMNSWRFVCFKHRSNGKLCCIATTKTDCESIFVVWRDRDWIEDDCVVAKERCTFCFDPLAKFIDLFGNISTQHEAHPSQMQNKIRRFGAIVCISFYELNWRMCDWRSKHFAVLKHIQCED